MLLLVINFSLFEVVLLGLQLDDFDQLVVSFCLVTNLKVDSVPFGSPWLSKVKQFKF